MSTRVSGTNRPNTPPEFFGLDQETLLNTWRGHGVRPRTINTMDMIQLTTLARRRHVIEQHVATGHTNRYCTSFRGENT